MRTVANARPFKKSRRFDVPARSLKRGSESASSSGTPRRPARPSAARGRLRAAGRPQGGADGRPAEGGRVAGGGGLGAVRQQPSQFLRRVLLEPARLEVNGMDDDTLDANDRP